MDLKKSLDVPFGIIAALLCDAQTLHGEVFTLKACRLTTEKVRKRLALEGMGFLTKTLPRLGKALDRALSGQEPLDATSLGFKALPDSKLPRFLGELFQCVLTQRGDVLSAPSQKCVKTIRQILYLFYKYQLPYSPDLEECVLQKFVKTEQDIQPINELLGNLADKFICEPTAIHTESVEHSRLIRGARRLLARLFGSFDCLDIHPKHGPGSVATRERLWSKYRWTCIPKRITDVYPLDAYFYASQGHVCDSYRDMSSLQQHELPARVLLVPKDSRGPRLISCEPLAFQWIQQGLGDAIVRLAERHPLTRNNVRFTDQEPNRMGALRGSQNGRYHTLDLAEASDRVSLGLVRLLFPSHVLPYLEASRSLSTVMPDGKEIKLDKFAPMGSALCFPILALSVWAILTAGVTDAYTSPRFRKETRRSIFVYGDDVIVPSGYSARAISVLELFGLKVNRDKSCTSGLFRESCGMDAFAGIPVTPVKLKTVWSSRPSPGCYTSYIAYANLMYDNNYHNAYHYISQKLFDVYGDIPSSDMNLSCPSLHWVPECYRPKRRRTNHSLQKQEWYVRDVEARPIIKHMDGWLMLLRYFSENTTDQPLFVRSNDNPRRCGVSPQKGSFSACLYTKRDANHLRYRWR